MENMRSDHITLLIEQAKQLPILVANNESTKLFNFYRDLKTIPEQDRTLILKNINLQQLTHSIDSHQSHIFKKNFYKAVLISPFWITTYLGTYFNCSRQTTSCYMSQVSFCSPKPVACLIQECLQEYFSVESYFDCPIETVTCKTYHQLFLLCAAGMFYFVFAKQVFKTDTMKIGELIEDKCRNYQTRN